MRKEDMSHLAMLISYRAKEMKAKHSLSKQIVPSQQAEKELSHQYSRLTNA